MINEIKRFYEFGDFRFDVQRQRLVRVNEPLLLPPKAMAVLLLFLERPGQVIEREELLQAVWGQTVVEDANLTVAISALRKTLGQDQHQTYIETVPRLGYRFVAEVREICGPVNETDSTVGAVTATAPTADEARAAVPSRFVKYVVAVGLSLLLLAGLAAALVWRMRQPGLPFQKISLERLPVTDVVDETAFTADGRFVAYSRIEGNQQSLWMYDLKTGGNALLVPPSEIGYRGLTFAPEGEFIYIAVQEANSRERNLYRLPSVGGELQLVRKDVPSPIGISPDGTQFAYVREERSTGESFLLVARFDQAPPRVLARRKMPDFFTLDGPAWSPDGTLIVNPGGSVEKEVFFTLFGVQVADGAIHPFTAQRWVNVRRARWLADGRGLVVSIQAAAQHTHQLFFLAYPSGTAHAITQDIGVYPRGADISADQQLMIAPLERHVSTLWLADASSQTAAQQLYPGVETLGMGSEEGLEWMADGRLLYVSRLNGWRELWVVRPEGRPQPLTTEVGTYQYPAVSADGRTIVVIRDNNLWRLNADGTNWVQLVHGSLPQDPQISPDQQWVLYSDETSGRRTLWKVPLQGGTPSQVSEHPTETGVISPDGQWIACFYWLAQQASLRIALLPFAGAAPAQFLPIPILDHPRRFFRWSRDGQALIYIANRADAANLWSYTLSSGTTRQLTDFKTDAIAAFDLAPDGKQFVISRFNVVSNLVLLRASK